MKTYFANLIRDDDGQDIIEYSLLAAFISIVAYAILGGIGTDVETIYRNVRTATTSAVGSLPS